MRARVKGGKATGTVNFSSYIVIVTSSTAGRALTSKPSNVGSVKARTICRIRSAR